MKVCNAACSFSGSSLTPPAAALEEGEEFCEDTSRSGKGAALLHFSSGFDSCQSPSHIATGLRALALPLTAILTLKASAAQIGLLGGAEFSPMLLLSLFAGVWIDRWPRRPVLLFSNLGRALLFFSIPALALPGYLRIEYLYIIGFLTGCLSVFFGIAYQSYLPALVEAEQLVEGNSKLGASEAVAEIAGPEEAFRWQRCSGDCLVRCWVYDPRWSLERWARVSRSSGCYSRRCVQMRLRRPESQYRQCLIMMSFQSQIQKKCPVKVRDSQCESAIIE